MMFSCSYHRIKYKDSYSTPACLCRPALLGTVSSSTLVLHLLYSSEMPAVRYSSEYEAAMDLLYSAVDSLHH